MTPLRLAERLPRAEVVELRWELLLQVSCWVEEELRSTCCTVSAVLAEVEATLI